MNIFWFRRDLRLTDNPALVDAVKNETVLPVYIFDTRDEFKIGGASKWWLHHSLESLNQALDGKLRFFHGDATKLIPTLSKTYKAKAVYWNKCYEPAFVNTDKAIEQKLQKEEVACNSYNGLLLWEPNDVLKGDGTPYKVFAPFLKLCLKKGLKQSPVTKPRTIDLFDTKPTGAVSLDSLKLLPSIHWDEGIRSTWTPGEEGAKKLLKSFLDSKLERYENERNYPSHDVLSRISPHLHFGEVSPLTIWNAACDTNSRDKNIQKFTSEFCWREFACHLLHHFPNTATESYDKQLGTLNWQYNKQLLQKWQQGKTGYPIVDAGMRQLWQTGYMHNRVRMITASFLVKNLLTDWRTGADWFLDCLVDADLAVNTMNWQWVAGTGLDAAPFFRVFNPVLQSKKYDAEGAFIKTFVPELKNVPARYLHQPWMAPKKVLDTAGVTLGKEYPLPCVDLQESIKAALDAYHKTKTDSK